MKKNIISGILFCFITTISGNTAFADIPEEMPLTSASAELKSAMKKLWEDHLVYTRNYIISDLGNLGDKSKIAERLLQNQADIGDAIKPFYGDEAGNKLTSLLKEHIVIATKVVDAAKNNQKKDLAKARADWIKNGDAIASFLSSANPNWIKSEMKHMLGMHLELTTDEVVSRLNKNWAKDIAAYDAGHVHMFMFADELAKGIVKQFPDQFRDSTPIQVTNDTKGAQAPNYTTK
ncbi:MAG: hypothetical protein PHY93_21105 [Bacteriovorax sp.]|nr:hypothetical protein [Bacteriovorax sp.]